MIFREWVFNSGLNNRINLRILIYGCCWIQSRVLIKNRLVFNGISLIFERMNLVFGRYMGTFEIDLIFRKNDRIL